MENIYTVQNIETQKTYNAYLRDDFVKVCWELEEIGLIEPFTQVFGTSFDGEYFIEHKYLDSLEFIKSLGLFEFANKHIILRITIPDLEIERI